MATVWQSIPLGTPKSWRIFIVFFFFLLLLCSTRLSMLEYSHHLTDIDIRSMLETGINRFPSDLELNMDFANPSFPKLSWKKGLDDSSSSPPLLYEIPSTKIMDASNLKALYVALGEDHQIMNDESTKTTLVTLTKTHLLLNEDILKELLLYSGESTIISTRIRWSEITDSLRLVLNNLCNPALSVRGVVTIYSCSKRSLKRNELRLKASRTFAILDTLSLPILYASMTISCFALNLLCYSVAIVLTSLLCYGWYRRTATYTTGAVTMEKIVLSIIVALIVTRIVFATVDASFFENDFVSKVTISLLVYHLALRFNLLLLMLFRISDSSTTVATDEEEFDDVLYKVFDNCLKINTEALWQGRDNNGVAYEVSIGQNPNAMEVIGKTRARSFLVMELLPDTTYYFKCIPKDYSVCPAVVTENLLRVPTTRFETKNVPISVEQSKFECLVKFYNQELRKLKSSNNN